MELTDKEVRGIIEGRIAPRGTFDWIGFVVGAITGLCGPVVVAVCFVGLGCITLYSKYLRNKKKLAVKDAFFHYKATGELPPIPPQKTKKAK